MSAANSWATRRAPASSTEARYCFPNTDAFAGVSRLKSNSDPWSTRTPFDTAVYPNARYRAFTGGPDQLDIQRPPPVRGGGGCCCFWLRRGVSTIGGGGWVKSEGCCGTF